MNTTQKPDKPYPEFPLFAHSRGQWAKKILGKTRYFGRFDDGWQSALESYQKQRDDLYAGREPKQFETSLTLSDLLNDYLEALDQRVDVGEVQRRHWNDCERTAKLVLETLPRSMPAASLTSRDFETLRNGWMQRFALSTVTGHIARFRAVINFANDHRLLPEPIRMGKRFAGPTAKQLRQERSEKPAKLFSEEEVNRLLDAATPKMRAMIMLGINVAFIPCDVGRLTWSMTDLESGWLTMHRTKTWVFRRSPLWPETIAAIEAATKKSNERLPDDLVFRTRCGNPYWVESQPYNQVSSLFGRLASDCKLTKKYRGFGSLRHTFQTIGDETGDYLAVKMVMGHVDPSISARYRERFPDARKVAVCDHVRGWLDRAGWPDRLKAIKKAKALADQSEIVG